MPNIIKATNLTVTKAFPKFFIAQDTFKKQDGSEGKQNYKVWSQSVVQVGQIVNITGTASAIVCTITPNDGTNNTGTPVTCTTANLVELINSGIVCLLAESNVKF